MPQIEEMSERQISGEKETERLEREIGTIEAQLKDASGEERKSLEAQLAIMQEKLEEAKRVEAVAKPIEPDAFEDAT